MGAAEPETVKCPLCGAVVADAADPEGAGDVQALERHFSKGCPARRVP